MKKRIVAILLIAMLIVTVMCFTGCDETVSSETNKAPFKWKMELVDEYWGFYVYREPVTDIMYILYNYSNEGGLTVMYDTDGTPLTNLCQPSPPPQSQIGGGSRLAFIL